VPSERRCYYLVGPSGFPNYGDELIASQWLRHLARTDPDADVWLDCHSPGPAQMLLGAEHPRVKFTDTLWRLCWQAPSDEPWAVASWVQHAVQDPGRAPRWVPGIELLARADVVHLIGGGYINALWPRHVGLLAGAVAAVRRSRGTAALTGLGFLPTPAHSVPLLRSLAARFDVVDVRDAPSAELLDGISAFGPTCDDVFLGLDVRRRRDGREPRYVICVQSDVGEVTWPRLAGQVLDMVRAWDARPQQVGVVESMPRVDREVFALIEHELPGVQFFSFTDIWLNGLPIAPQQTWISTRFHPHLFAAAAGACGVALSVRPDYYDVKHASLLGLGSGWQLRDAGDSRPPPEEPTSGGFTEDVLTRCREMKRQVADAIYPPTPSGEATAAVPQPAAAGPPAASRPAERQRGEVRIITPRI